MFSLHGLTSDSHDHTYLRVGGGGLLTSFYTCSHVRCYASNVFFTWSHIPSGGGRLLTSFCHATLYISSLHVCTSRSNLAEIRNYVYHALCLVANGVQSSERTCSMKFVAANEKGKKHRVRYGRRYLVWVCGCSFAKSTLALMDDASRGEENGWMIWWMFAWGTWKSQILNGFFITRRTKLIHCAGEMFLNWSHTPANRDECPCRKHLLTSPTNTSILPLSFENLNFKFVTLTTAASQPVA